MKQLLTQLNLSKGFSKVLFISIVLGILTLWIILQLVYRNNSLRKELKIQKERTDRFYESAINCGKNPDSNTDTEIWDFLPDNLKAKTYKEKVISAGEALYNIIPLEWSEDCIKLAFVLELEGRDGGAYKDKDYEPRGIYVFDSDARQIKTIKIFGKNSYQSKDYYRNLWSSFGDYHFEEITENGRGEFIGRRYEYNPETNQLKLDYQ